MFNKNVVIAFLVVIGALIVLSLVPAIPAGYTRVGQNEYGETVTVYVHTFTSPAAMAISVPFYGVIALVGLYLGLAVAALLLFASLASNSVGLMRGGLITFGASMTTMLLLLLPSLGNVIVF